MKHLYSLSFMLLFACFARAQDPIVLTECLSSVVTCGSTSSDATVAAIKQAGNTAAAPFGNNWNPPTQIPTSWSRDSMGEVFGTAIDDAGNVYFGATAIYYWQNLNIASLSTPSLPNQTVISGFNLGYHPFAGPGGVYKADATDLNNTNPLLLSVSSTSTTPSGVGTNVIVNNGFGIGNLAYGSQGDKVYATNLEDGTIVVANATTGNIDQIYDPFALDNGAVGIAPVGERLFGIAVQSVSTTYANRVYYAVLSSVGVSEIYSIEIASNGLLLPPTNTLEIIVNHNSNMNAVTDIAFSQRGELLLACKGDFHAAQVIRYVGDHNAWSFEQVMPTSTIGTPPSVTRNNSAGGVDFGPESGPNGDPQCDEIAWSMCNYIESNGTSRYYGMLGQPREGYLNLSTYLTETYIVDLDGAPSGNKGRFGDVEFFSCECEVAFQEPCDSVSIATSPVFNDTTGFECCYTVDITNRFSGQFFTGLNIKALGTATIASVTAINDTSSIIITDPQNVSLPYINGSYLPLSVPGDTLAFEICIQGGSAGSMSDPFSFEFIGTAPQFDTVCAFDTELETCGESIEASCAAISDYRIFCENGIYTMDYRITNNADFIMRGITLYDQDSTLSPIDRFIPIPDLAPDSSFLVQNIPLALGPNFGSDTTACFLFSACDVNIDPLISSIPPTNCCIDSILYCAPIPECGIGAGEGCYGLDISSSQQEGDDCCFDLNLNIASIATPISCIEFSTSGGAQFAILSGWNIQPGLTSNSATLCAPSNTLSPGQYDAFAQFCLTGFAQSPYSIAIAYKDSTGTTVCNDTLRIDAQCDLVEPECITFTDYSISCQGDSTVFDFSIFNTADFDVKQFEIQLSDTSYTISPQLFIPDSGIAQGTTGGPFQMQVLTANLPDEPLCMYLTAHNAVYDTLTGTAATICCTDSIGSVICLDVPVCDTMLNAACCTFDLLEIPNGLTPNGDGINDIWEIKSISGICEPIKITVFNRWGNEVYKDNNYSNNWDGRADNGNLLLQGTYHVKIELSNGSHKLIYIDIRY